MTTNFEDVGAFHHKFNLDHVDPHCGASPGLRDFPSELLRFRSGFLHEELEEFDLAAIDGDVAGMADALVDLVYVAMGTAHLMGLPWQALWDEVQRANMAKERSTGADDSRSKRGSAFDVVKPVGWIPPDMAGVLANYGFGTVEGKCGNCGDDFGDIAARGGIRVDQLTMWAVEVAPDKIVKCCTQLCAEQYEANL